MVCGGVAMGTRGCGLLDVQYVVFCQLQRLRKGDLQYTLLLTSATEGESGDHVKSEIQRFVNYLISVYIRLKYSGIFGSSSIRQI